MTKLYFAGPLMSTAEIRFNESVVSNLRMGCKHEVFLPQENEQRADTPRAIFNSDMAGLHWCDMVVANMDGADPDSGTCWELGWAYAMDRPCIIWRTDFRIFAGLEPLNLMMGQSARKVLLMPRASAGELAVAIHKAVREIEHGGE